MANFLGHPVRTDTHSVSWRRRIVWSATNCLSWSATSRSACSSRSTSTNAVNNSPSTPFDNTITTSTISNDDALISARCCRSARMRWTRGRDETSTSWEKTHTVQCVVRSVAFSHLWLQVMHVTALAAWLNECTDVSDRDLSSVCVHATQHVATAVLSTPNAKAHHRTTRTKNVRRQSSGVLWTWNVLATTLEPLNFFTVDKLFCVAYTTIFVRLLHVCGH